MNDLKCCYTMCSETWQRQYEKCSTNTNPFGPQFVVYYKNGLKVYESWLYDLGSIRVETVFKNKGVR